MNIYDDFLVKKVISCDFYEEYKKLQNAFDAKYKSPYLNYLAHLQTKELGFEYYTHHTEFIKYAVENNALHADNAKDYQKTLNSFLTNNDKKLLTSNIKLTHCSNPSLFIYINKHNNAVASIFFNKYTPTDFSTFVYGNWRKIFNNKTINAICDMGGAIVVNKNAKISLKLTKSSRFKEYTLKDAAMMISAKLGIEVKISNTYNDKTHTDDDILTYELMCVEGKRFNPLKREEYYQEKGVWYRNIFEPTGYMKLKGKSKKETTAIFRLIYHIVNNDEERFLYVINWLSYFFKRLKKSYVALLLIGDQRAGKGVLFEKILS